MKAVSLSEIKKDLRAADPDTVQEIVMRLARFKKENKELLSYLLYDSTDEQNYVNGVKEELNALFSELPVNTNVYYLKKSLRKILRAANRQIRYSGIKTTELELRMHCCLRMKEARVPIEKNSVIRNLYQSQLDKIESLLKNLPEDLRADYDRDLEIISMVKR